MTEWVARFDYPAGEWLLLDMGSADGAERAAQQVADRGGRKNKRYAKAVYQEIKDLWQTMDVALTELMVVHVPTEQRRTAPLSPASAHTTWLDTDYERTLEAVMEKARAPLDDPNIVPVGEPEVTSVELPVGPTCRVHRTVTRDTGWEQLTMEYLNYYVLQDTHPEELLMLDVFWLPNALGPGMVELADQMAATLRIVPRDSGEAPRPVLAPPGDLHRS
jgi:hypothetical protein